MDEELQQMVADLVAQGMGDEEIAAKLRQAGYDVQPQGGAAPRSGLANALGAQGRMPTPAPGAGASYRAPADAAAQVTTPKPARRYAEVSAGDPSAIARTFLGQGVALGAGDEIEGGARAIFGKLSGDSRPLGALYDEAREEAENEVLGYRESNPLAAGALELAGGLASGTGAGLGVRAALKAGGRELGEAAMRSTVRKVATGAAAGAAGGAAAGAASAQPGNRFKGGLIGGTLGTVFPAVGGAAAAGGRAARRMVPVLQRIGAKDEASARILRAILNDETTPTEIREKALKLYAQGAKPEMLVDLAGPNVRGAAEAIIATPGKGSTKIVKALDDRQRGAPGRLADDLERLGDTADEPLLSRPGAPVGRSMTELAKDKTDEFAPLYDLAYRKGNILSKAELAPYMNRPAAREAWKRAQRAMRNKGMKTRPLYDAEGNMARTMSVKEFDMWKRALDDTLEDPKLIERGGLSRSNIVDVQEGIRRPAIDIVDEKVPEYAAARQKAGDRIRAERAGMRAEGDVRGERAFTTESPSELASDFATFAEPEKELYRVGARRNLRSTLGGLRSPEFGSFQNYGARLYGTPDQRARMGIVFDDAGREVIDLAERESTMFTTAGELTKGSPTARRLFAAADQNDVDVLNIGRDLMRGDVGSFLSGGFQRAQRRAQGLTPRVQDIMAEGLTTPNWNGRGAMGVTGDTPLVRYLDDLENWRVNKNRGYYTSRGRVGGASSWLAGTGAEQ